MSSMAYGSSLLPQPFPAFGSAATMPSLLPTTLFGSYPPTPASLSAPGAGTGTYYDPATGSYHVYAPGVNLPPGATVTPGISYPKMFFDPATGTSHVASPGVNIPPGSVVGNGIQFGSGVGAINYLGDVPRKGGGTSAVAATATPKSFALPTGGSNPFAITKAGKGKGAGLLDPKIVAKLTQVPDLSYKPIVPGAPPNIVGYKPALMPTGKALWNSLPDYKFASAGEKAILDAAVKEFNANAGNQIKQITDFSRAVQNLPSLAGPALAIAKGILKPQADAAAAAGLRTSNFIRLLGQATAGIQNQTAGTIGASYRSSAETLNALAQAVGGGLGAGMAAQVAGTPQNPLAPSVQPTGLPGGLDIRGVPLGAQQATQMIQGTLPATGLTKQAPFATAADASLANVIMGGARQQSLMALAQGNQNVAQIMAQLPQYQQQALTQLTTERNAALDRQLSLMQMSGQISASQRDAIMTRANTEAGVYGTDVSGLNARNLGAWQTNVQNLGTNVAATNQAASFGASAQNAANIAQASRDLQVKIANSQGALTAANDRAAYQQRSLANYFSYMRMIYAANKPAAGTTVKAPDFTKMQQNLSDWSNGVYSKSPTIMKDANGNSVAVRVLQRQKLPVNRAWLNFKTAYSPYYSQLYGPNAGAVMWGAFRGFYPGIPDSWNIKNVEQNRGPLAATADGRITKAGPLQQLPAPQYITVVDGTAFTPGG